MSESFTETSYESHPKRVIGSIVVSILSIFFIYLFFIFHIHCEHFVKLRQLGLTEAGKKVISVDCHQVKEKNEGKVIHLVGDLQSNETIHEPVFDLRFRALKVVRNVEMYQWDENVSTTETVMPGGDAIKRKTYTYKKIWSEVLIDSSHFRKKKYKNPKKIKIEKESFYVNNAYVGEFSVSIQHIQNLDTKFAKLPSLKSVKNDKYAGRIFLTDQGQIYLGQNPKEPRIGDLKISYHIAKAGKYSLIGEQKMSAIEPFLSEKKMVIAVVKKGKYKPRELITLEKKELSNLSWIFRGIFLCFYILFIYLIFKPTAVLADVIPWFGEVTRLKVFCQAVVLGLFFSITTILVGKFYFEPISEMNGKFVREVIEKILTYST